MKSDPFYRGPGEPAKPRQLTEPAAPAMSSETQVGRLDNISPEETTKLFDGLAFQINRATSLIKAIEANHRAGFIPVDVEAVRVRAAIRRQVPGSDGSQISFDLYKDMLDFQVRAARNMSFEVVGDLSGELVTDAKKIKKYMKSGGKGLSPWEEFLLYADQWLILFLLDRVTTQFQCVQHKECTVAKNPPGVEDPSILQRNAESIAALLLILGMQESDVLFALDQAGNALNIPPVDLLNRAKRLEKSDLDRALVEMIGADDPQAVTSYADNYMARHPDGYDDWIAYRDLRIIREDAMVSYVHAHEYSSPHATLLDFEGKSVVNTPTIGVVGTIAGAINSQIGVRSMTGAHFDALLSKLAGLDLTISSIAGTLTFQYGLDVLCCLARFFSKQELKTLKKIRKMLEIYKASLTGRLPTSFVSSTNPLDWATQAILQQLVSFIEETFDKTVSDVWGWVENKDQKTWDALEACPLIADLIGFIAEGILYLRNLFFNFITKYASNLSKGYQAASRRWGSISDIRRCTAVIGVIDLILNTAEACSVSGGGGRPTVPDPIDDPGLSTANPPKLTIPPDEAAEFFSGTGFIKRGDGEHPIPPTNHVVSTADAVTTVKNFRNLCLGILPDSILEQVEKSSEGQ